MYTYRYKVLTYIGDSLTMSGWLSGKHVCPSYGHTKYQHKNGTNCLPAWHICVRSLTVQPDCLEHRSWVLCGTVYGDMHFKDLLESIVKKGYCILVIFNC